MNKLRTVRKKKGIAIVDIARKVGVTESYIALIERGQRTPSLTIAEKIAAVLESSVDDIFLSRNCT